MTIELPEEISARLAAIAERWGKSPAELAEWLLLPELERIEANAQTKTPEVSDALRAKIAATPLLIVDDSDRRTMESFKKPTAL